MIDPNIDRYMLFTRAIKVLFASFVGYLNINAETLQAFKPKVNEYFKVMQNVFDISSCNIDERTELKRCRTGVLIIIL